MNKSIQVISQKINNNYKGQGVTLSTFDKPQSLDSFDINVIDLTSELIWRNNGNDFNSINCINDLINLSKMILNCEICRIVYIYPSDCYFKNMYQWRSGSGSDFRSGDYIRNQIYTIESKILIPTFKLPYLGLIYENTISIIQGLEIESNFSILGEFKSLIKSEKSNKITAILYNSQYITTLMIKEYDQLIVFLKEIDLIEKDTFDTPGWLKEILMFDDGLLNEENQKHLYDIRDLNRKIKLNNEKLFKNERLKSVLYTNGDQLVEVVFEILQNILDVDLSNFQDEKNEDFIIKYDNVHLIGEIKGVTSNVKSEHVSQVDVHLNGYLDKFENYPKGVIIKSILIVNHQRNKPLSERQPIHERQKELAVRNNCLIIETETLLKIYERILNGESEITDVRDFLSKKCGLLQI